MAAHSTCQPGLPRPNRESQAGSPGRSARQTRASSGSFFPGRPGSPPRCAARSAISAGSYPQAVPGPDSAPKRGSAALAKYRSSSRSYRAPRSASRAVNSLDHRQRLHRPDQVVRRQDAQRLHVAAVPLDLAAGQLTPVLAVTLSALEQRVVDVRDVLHVADGVPRGRAPRRRPVTEDLGPGVQPGPHQQVPRGVGERVPDVRRVIGRDAAGVQRGHRAGGGEDQLARGRVVDPGRRAAARQHRDIRTAPGVHARQVIAHRRRQGTAD